MEKSITLLTIDILQNDLFYSSYWYEYHTQFYGRYSEPARLPHQTIQQISGVCVTVIYMSPFQILKYQKHPYLYKNIVKTPIFVASICEWFNPSSHEMLSIEL